MGMMAGVNKIMRKVRLRSTGVRHYEHAISTKYQSSNFAHLIPTVHISQV